MTQLEAGGRPCLMGRWLRSDGLAMGQVLLSLMRGSDDVAGADAFGRGHHVRLRVQTQDNALPHIDHLWYSLEMPLQRLKKTTERCDTAHDNLAIDCHVSKSVNLYSRLNFCAFMRFDK